MVVDSSGFAVSSGRWFGWTCFVEATEILWHVRSLLDGVVPMVLRLGSKDQQAVSYGGWVCGWLGRPSLNTQQTRQEVKVGK